ncbi:hypothetical protein cyc_04643 [Cyclospora cayetanensis]|uniref:Uncharacterized protein n=1 Tax=Cyclospora cayetanensis TaxID=88456 RepID=A0A1D3CYS5_9EIME|nr:hypothetical protein cyc_04643 [Cyclospora cayetanensis]
MPLQQEHLMVGGKKSFAFAAWAKTAVPGMWAIVLRRELSLERHPPPRVCVMDGVGWLLRPGKPCAEELPRGNGRGPPVLQWGTRLQRTKAEG